MILEEWAQEVGFDGKSYPHTQMSWKEKPAGQDEAGSDGVRA